MTISETMNDKLNEQITAELSAAHSYLAMVCAFEDMGLKILAKRFLAQHSEEREHAMKILHYVHEVGGTVRLDVIPKPGHGFPDVATIVRTALEHEQEVTRQIHDMVALALEEKDYATNTFLQWFVSEQVEEESSMRDLLALVEMAGDNILQVEARIRHEMMSPT